MSLTKKRLMELFTEIESQLEKLEASFEECSNHVAESWFILQQEDLQDCNYKINKLAENIK